LILAREPLDSFDTLADWELDEEELAPLGDNEMSTPAEQMIAKTSPET
jgi:hypothetical protein